MSADLSGIEFCSLTVCFVELFVIQIKFLFFLKKKKKQKKTLVSFLISCYNFSELPMEFYSWN